MGVAASSSSSSPSKKYDVFLSFRGEGIRNSFSSHLHTALCLKGIETFIDYELPKGDDISQSLIQAIQDSSVSVIVFSENYASSKWCLNELIHILRCNEKKGQHVVPIFYQVDPSHVRHQRGAYEAAFAQHLKSNPDKVAEWRKALSETTSLVGWDYCKYRDEAELIQNIVSDIIKRLNLGSSSELANIVGLDENCDSIEFLLERFSFIGIWGMGGVGKTTMAKVLFAKFHSQFDSCYFLENFREQSEKHGLGYIRDKLANGLSNDRSLKGLSRRKVLIVLDDVSDTSHLEYLEKEVDCSLRHGSKVIITSRDRHVFEGRVEIIHEVMTLGHDSSLELFNLKAFCEDSYKSEYKELVERALSYSQGVPLALIVLGSFLHSRNIEEWESSLSKLERRTHPNIQHVLKLSYNGLDDEEKEVFLDIACFLKGESEGYVLAMLKRRGFHEPISLRTLKEKALISIDLSVVQMHDLIQSMAFEIVRQECLTNPERRSRLWNSDKIYDVLKHNRGSDAIQSITLDLFQIGDLHLSVDTFEKKYKVFLSFRGKDTRRSFTSHLYTALCDKGIDTFIDHKLRKGDHISKSLIQAIEDSSLSVIVFSKNYAYSKWCLNELIEILRCKEEKGQLVVPIFYQVDPSHVRHQRGAYAKAFAQHLKKNTDKVAEWRKALYEAASLAGWDSCQCNSRDDAVLIQNIVTDIIRKTKPEARDLISTMTANSQQFGTRGNSTAVYQIQAPPVQYHSAQKSITSSLDQQRLENRLDDLTSLVRQLAVTQTVQSPIPPIGYSCGFCFDPYHSTDSYPILQDTTSLDQSTAAVGVFPRKPQYLHQNNAFSNTYNSGWRDHQNFRWIQNQNHNFSNYQQRQIPQNRQNFQQSAPPLPAICVPPQPTQHQTSPSGSSSEEMMKQLATNSLQFQQQTETSIQSLQTQIRQLATSLNQFQPQGSYTLPSQTILNPTGNVSSISIQSGNQLEKPK